MNNCSYIYFSIVSSELIRDINISLRKGKKEMKKSFTNRLREIKNRKAGLKAELERKRLKDSDINKRRYIERNTRDKLGEK